MTHVDYYETLGVHVSAQDFVIRAAYRALAQRYHPDKLGSGEGQPSGLMARINEAYEVLSDPKRRRDYDTQRESEHSTRSTIPPATDLFEPPPPGISFANTDWDKACEYYPDLPKIDDGLSRISWKLAWMYRSALMESKRFEQRIRLAADLQLRFLETYFGSNHLIISFAKQLIFSGYYHAAIELSEAVNVLGVDVPHNIIIDQVTKKFDLVQSRIDSKVVERTQLLLHYCECFDEETGSKFDICNAIVHQIGGHFDWTFWGFRVKSLHVWNKTYRFKTNDEMEQWVRKHVVEPVFRGETPGP